MENLASDLIRKALHQEDEYKIIEKIGEAIKLITDNVPYEEVYTILENDQLLIKYLILSLPFQSETVEATINLLLYLLQDSAVFFRNMLVSVTEVVMLQPKVKGKVIPKNYEDYMHDLNLDEKSGGGASKSKNKNTEAAYAYFDARTMIDMYPKQIRRNIVYIKRMTMIIVEKSVEIIKAKFKKFSKKQRVMLSDSLFSYFKHLLIFSTDSDLIDIILKTMRELAEFAPNIIRPIDITRLKDLSSAKTKEQKDINEKKKMKSKLRERRFAKLDKRRGILKFKNMIKQHGLLSTIKAKMKRVLNRAKQNLDPHQDEIEHDLADFKDFLEEFLISDDLKIASNSFLINYLKQDDRNLDILISFITQPFNYSLAEFFIKKHRNFKDLFGEMDYQYPRTFEQFGILDTFKAERLRTVVSIAFNPGMMDKHGMDDKSIDHREVYYVRCFYAVMFLTDRDNHIFLIKNNKTFIEVLFNNLYRALKETSNVVNMNLVLYLYKFYFNVEPNRMIYNFLRFNLVHHLIFNVDKPGVSDFLITVIDPFDCMQTVPENVKLYFWRYIKESGIFLDLANICLRSFNGLKDSKFDKSYQNSEMMYAIKNLESADYELNSSPLFDLISTDSFYTDIFKDKEIVEERIDTGGLDIDWIFDMETSDKVDYDHVKKGNMTISGQERISSPRKKLISRLPKLDNSLNDAGIGLMNNIKSIQDEKSSEFKGDILEEAYDDGDDQDKKMGNIAKYIFHKQMTFEEKKIVLMKRGNTLRFHKNQMEQLGTFSESEITLSENTRNTSELPQTNMVKDYFLQGEQSFKIPDLKEEEKKGFEFVKKKGVVINCPNPRYLRMKKHSGGNVKNLKFNALKSLTVKTFLRPLYWFKKIILNSDNLDVFEGRKHNQESSGLFLGLKDIKPRKPERDLKLSKKNSFRITIGKVVDPKSSSKKKAKVSMRRMFATPRASPKTTPQQSATDIRESDEMSGHTSYYSKGGSRQDFSIGGDGGVATNKVKKSGETSIRQKSRATLEDFSDLKRSTSIRNKISNKSKSNMRRVKTQRGGQMKSPSIFNKKKLPVKVKSSRAREIKSKKMSIFNKEETSSSMSDYKPNLLKVDVKNLPAKRSSFNQLPLSSSRKIKILHDDEALELESSALYPNKPVRVDLPKETENLMMSEEFSHQNIQDTEYLSFPSSKVIYFCVRSAFDYKLDSFSAKLGFKNYDIISFWSTFLGPKSHSETFETLYLTFLLKFEHSVLINRQETTGFYTLRTINLVIRKMISSPILQKYKREANLLFEKYLMYFDELVHNVYQCYQKRYKYTRKVKLAGKIKIMPLGCHRLELIDHFFLIIMNHKDAKDTNLITRLNMRLVHIVIKWIQQHMDNQILMNRFVAFLKHCFKYGYEDIFIGIFVKLNFVATLKNIYDKIYVNDVFVNATRLDHNIMIVRDIVKLVLKVQKDEENFPKFSKIMKSITTWRSLILQINKSLEARKESSRSPGLLGRLKTRRSSLYVRNDEKHSERKKTSRKASNFKYELNHFTSTTSLVRSSGSIGQKSSTMLPKIKSRDLERMNTQFNTQSKKSDKKFKMLQRGFSSSSIVKQKVHFADSPEKRKAPEVLNFKLFLPKQALA